MHSELDRLRRRPDLEAPGLVAVDAADRLILDRSATARENAEAATVGVIGDAYGALTLGAALAGATGIRVHQDALTGERALAANADDLALSHSYRSLPLTPELVRGARVVLLRLPRTLDQLDDIAGIIAAHAAPDVAVFAGGRLKHMSVAMNDVLARRFDRVDVTHARQKSRVLVARGPHDGTDPTPRQETHEGITVCAFGGAFAGTSIDIGTRLLLAHLPAPTERPVIDMACGTGVVAASWATRHPRARVIASDQSAIAVPSAKATVAANGVAGRVEVVRDDMLGAQPDRSTSLIALNPPFHSGAAVTGRIAPLMFADAARVLAPGGELWTVWNSSLGYRAALERIVGPTRQIARNAKFTVTASTRR